MARELCCIALTVDIKPQVLGTQIDTIDGTINRPTNEHYLSNSAYIAEILRVMMGVHYCKYADISGIKKAI